MVFTKLERIFAIVNLYAHFIACSIAYSSAFLTLDCLFNFQLFEIV